MIGVVEDPSQRIREDRGSLDERYAVLSVGKGFALDILDPHHGMGLS